MSADLRRDRTEANSVRFERLSRHCDLLALHRQHPQRYPFFLESVVHGTAQARYDILFAFPGDRLERDPAGTIRLNDRPVSHGDFLDRLAATWSAEQIEDAAPVLLPFTGGWFLFLGYELVNEIEPGLSLPVAEGKVPVAMAVRCPAALIRDHQTGQLWAVCEQQVTESIWSCLLDDVARSGPQVDNQKLPPVTSWREAPPQLYIDGITQVQQYIHDGDVFQVNLSRQWEASWESAPVPWQLYQLLRRHNPAPFAGLAVLRPGQAIISSSPERLVQMRGRQVSTRPIAGTHPRLKQADADATQARALVAHPKERAEHIMLIDLERNDLGRVCEHGSVVVSELMTVESYQHVHHIVSQIEGRLQQDAGPVDVIRAVFPGGTITGCPKVRCMEIIAELEQTGRGAYTGSMGYLNRNGDMDLNILIRTLVLEGKQLRFRAGAGIVADSVPERELAETRAKAAGLVCALEQGAPDE